MGGQVSIEGLYFQYKRNSKPVLSNLNVQIPPNSIFGLVGKNGSGKTTLFGLILAMLKPQKGVIRITDRNGKELYPGAIGFLPERPYYHEEFRLLEYLQHLSRISPRTLSRHDLEKIIAGVALSEYCKTPLREFSKGMLQRVGIAQTLLEKPQILILDEPMAGLDPAGQSLMRDIVKSIHARGTTILISSHNLYEIERLSTHVGLLNNCRLEMLDLKTQKPEKQITVSLAKTEKDLQKIFAEIPRVKVSDPTISFFFTKDLYQKIMIILLENELIIEKLHTQGFDLESLTKDLWGRSSGLD